MDVVLTAVSADRFGDRVHSAAPGVALWTMGGDGVLVSPVGEPADRAAELPIEVAWATADLFDQGAPLRPFFGLVRRLGSLRWLQSPAAGIDAPIFAELLRKGVRLTSAHVNSVAIAEYVLRAVLDHYQRADLWRADQAAHRWAHHEFREVAGTRWLVVGLGSIGREVATRAGAFGAEVVGVRRRPQPDDPVLRSVAPGAVQAELPAADVVVLSAPATPSTTGMVDAAFLAAMKPGSVLVNVARGALVDEEALRRSLDAGVPAVAVLDVVATEPLPADSWLWSHPRVVITPHNAAAGDGRFERAAELFCENLRRYGAGQPLRHEVSVEALEGP